MYDMRPHNSASGADFEISEAGKFAQHDAHAALGNVGNHTIPLLTDWAAEPGNDRIVAHGEARLASMVGRRLPVPNGYPRSVRSNFGVANRKRVLLPLW